VSRSVPIDAAFEREALDAARTCWVCQSTFPTAPAKDKHMHDAHPNRHRLPDWPTMTGPGR
jgi:hypothetical protein